MENLGQPYSLAKFSYQKYMNSSTIVSQNQKNLFSQNQLSKNKCSESFQESMNHLKIKMKQIQKIIHKKSDDSHLPTTKKSKLPVQNCYYLRKTVPFTQSHDQIKLSAKSEKTIYQSQNLLLRADQLIKKYNHLSQRIQMKKQQYLNSVKQKYNSVLDKSFQNISSLETSYSYSPSFKQTQGKEHQLDTSIDQQNLDLLRHKKRQNIQQKLIHLQQEKATQNENLIKDDFQFLRLLGKGKFGQVHLGMHKRTGFLVAIKKVSKTNLIKFNMIQRFSQEIHLHSKLDHPNIVKFYGFYQQEQYICLVLQYLSGGTLFQFQNTKGTFTIKQATGFLREVISALTYLHQQRIAHRDLKPQNIVLSSTGMAKLCDFGWSTVVQSMRTTFCGTLDYASPEILQKREYDWSVDVWCVGVLTYELLIGCAPFENFDRQQVMEGIINVDKTKLADLDSLPEQAQQFITALLQKDPIDRPKIYQLLDFPLFMIDKNRKIPVF